MASYQTGPQRQSASARLSRLSSSARFSGSSSSSTAGLGPTWPAQLRPMLPPRGRRQLLTAPLRSSASMIVPVVTEVVRRSAANPTQLLAAGNAIATVSNGILGPNTLLFYGMVCGLSASVGATVMSILKVVWEAMEHLVCKDTSPAAQEELFLFGVDVSNSEYLTRPEVVRAAEYAAVAHKGQMRKTQDPYIVHCIETACIVEALLNVSEPDSRAETAVIAALLHDVTDDTNLTKLDVLTAFGSEVADMVEKVSQLSQMNQLVRRQTRQTAGQRSKGEQDQLRNMILKMVEEPLVIVIKLADRLHNMRTVYALKPEKQRAVATETMQIWCSLAERLGMFALKSELEDLCFAVLHPAEYRALRSELDAFWGLQSIPNFSLSPEAQAFLGGADTSGDASSSAHQTGCSEELAPAAPAAVLGSRSRAPAAAAEALDAPGTRQPAGSTAAHGQATTPAAGAVAVPAVPAAQAALSSLPLPLLRPPPPPRSLPSAGDAFSATPAASSATNAIMAGVHAARQGSQRRGASAQAALHQAAGANSAPASTSPVAASSQAPAAAQLASVGASAAAEPPAAAAVATLDAKPAHPRERRSLDSPLSADDLEVLHVMSTRPPAPKGKTVKFQRIVRNGCAQAGPHPVSASAAAAPVAPANRVPGADRSAGTVSAAFSTSGPAVAPITLERSSPSNPSTSAATGTVQQGNGSAGHGTGSSSSSALVGVSSEAAQRSRGGASTSGRSMHSSDDSFLSPEQREAKELIASVLPFDALMFKSQRHIPPSARRGLEVLEVCARRLLREIQIEPYATGLDVQVQGRLKSVHSMCRKMGRKGVTLDKIYDARALRVVVDDEGGAKHQEAVQACYDLLSTVRRLWRPVQGETDDYIQNPKPSGYQSLHAAVIGPGGVPMEIQIRTSSMHENAEYGAAAHWAYKENTPKQPGAGVEDIQEGQPVLRVSPAKLRKGVVVRREAGLNGAVHLTVAMQSGAHLPALDAHAPDSLQPYKDIMAYVKEKQWFAAGHGDLHVYLEEYALMKDGRYHRMDHMGFKHRNTTITPMQAYHELEKAAQVAQAVAASKAPEAAAAPEKRLERSESKAFLREQRQLEEKTRLMRSMLEWNREMDSGGGQVGGKTTDVMVLMWPSNEIALLPRGTTAVDIMRLQGKSDALGVPSTFGWVNVNNQLVPAATPLQDGDLVVLSSEILEI